MKYLLSLQAVREKANAVFSLAEKGKLQNFQYHADRLQETADFVIDIIQVSGQAMGVYRD